MSAGVALTDWSGRGRRAEERNGAFRSTRQGVTRRLPYAVPKPDVHGYTELLRTASRPSPSGATLCVDLSSAPLLVLGDRDALQQLFAKLLANAAQAVGSGGRIDVTATADAGLVVVTADDDGPGITPEDLTRVREPFFSTRSEGTGLGLAIADRIAAAHHAKLQIDSAPGKGTRVEVRFAAFEGPERPTRT